MSAACSWTSTGLPPTVRCFPNSAATCLSRSSNCCNNTTTGPYWRTAKDIVAGIIAQNDRALHLSVHSFTPILNGKVRNADIGLLYDPSRSAEKLFCRQWQKALAATQPTLRIRRNYPYRGNADALVTSLRQNFGENSYLGIEIEINQAIPLSGKNTWARLQQALIAALRKTLRNINA